MKTQRLLLSGLRLGVVTAFAACWIGAVQAIGATTPCQTRTYVNSITSWTGTQTIDPFDTTLGTLTSVHIEVTASADITHRIENWSTEHDFSITSGAKIRVFANNLFVNPPLLSIGLTA